MNALKHSTIDETSTESLPSDTTVSFCVNGWEIVSFMGKNDEEPRIQDLVLAQRLGFERHEAIRDLIKRHVAAGNLSDSEFFRTVGKNEDPKGRGRPATEYWLTEAGALFIVTKSETSNAIALTKEMIRVFQLARRGLLHRPEPNPISREEMVNIIQGVVRSELDAANQQTTLRPLIGPGIARTHVLDPVKEIAHLKAKAIRRENEWTRIRMKVDLELRRELGIGNQRWAMLPSAELGRAVCLVARKLDEAKYLAKASGRMQQVPLKLVVQPKGGDLPS